MPVSAWTPLRGLLRSIALHAMTTLLAVGAFTGIRYLFLFAVGPENGKFFVTLSKLATSAIIVLFSAQTIFSVSYVISVRKLLSTLEVPDNRREKDDRKGSL